MKNTNFEVIEKNPKYPIRNFDSNLKYLLRDTFFILGKNKI